MVSAILGGRAIWAVPVAFVGAMAIGGIVGLSGVSIPRTEAVIAVSLVALGLAIAVSRRDPGGVRLPLWLVTVFVVTFGAAHGNAHGLEVPSSANPTAFTVGFLVATSTLHLVGVGVGLLAIGSKRMSTAVRLVGLFTAALGVGLLAK